jgi:hypothetical protein
MKSTLLITASKKPLLSSTEQILVSDLRLNESIKNATKWGEKYFNKVEVIEVFHWVDNIRKILKILDYLLPVDGLLSIHLLKGLPHGKFFRSIDQIRYEISISLNGRFDLVEWNDSTPDAVQLVYKKIEDTNVTNDNSSSWTFGIPSGGENIDLLRDTIKSIRSQEIPNYEILICGPEKLRNYFENQKDIQIVEEKKQKDIRVPICHKKNQLLSSSQYENLMIMHDRYTLPLDWYERMKEFGNYFDILCLPTVNRRNERFAVDWMEWGYPISDRMIKIRFLSYFDKSHHTIVPGGCVVLKKQVSKLVSFDERLFWGELEDVHLSKVAHLMGCSIELDAKNKVVSKEMRHTANGVGSGVLALVKSISIMKVIVLQWIYKYSREK